MTIIALLPDTLALHDDTLNAWVDGLGDEDRQRIGHFRAGNRRREFVVARALLAALALEQLGAVARVASATGEPPRLLTATGDSMACSISHSGNAVLVGLTDQGSIGVDVERHRPRTLDRLVDRYFWQQGRDFFHSQTREAAQHWFYRAWCTREALLKYRGEGNLFQALGSPLALAFPTEARVGQSEQLTLATVFDSPGEPDVVVAGAGRDGRLSFNPPEPSGPLPQLEGLVAAPPGPV
jgi:phosphopantetheinyl transferase